VLVIGVGNPLRGDDGIGPEIIRRLKARANDENVAFMDGGTDGLALIDPIREYDGRVILVDAVDMKLPPGEMRIFGLEDVHIPIKSDSLSTHGFGIAEMILLMKNLEWKTNLTIIGIQPLKTGFNDKLSEPIMEKLETFIEIIEGEMTC